ncbi:glutaredoxin family protein [Pseudomarimonas arenosa]|uniref:Glutaredoxin family protein n=1 Tax=Pseudomarimonas arenosa TaxID=2774145 RepID=A0AAW3ZQT6_9GAMM|nr:glutaredoxin family protein [Pseudomarimonas arenosa]MBD8528313.1 glutaredoxin family protein [Pseudomarimonas arenosa]
MLVAACFLLGQAGAPHLQRAYAQWFPEPKFYLADNSSYFVEGRPRIVVFGTEDCPWCKKLRVHLLEKGIEFDDRRVDSSEQALVEFNRLEGQAVPLTLVGSRRIQGYEPEVIAAAVDALKQELVPSRRLASQGE